MIQISKLSLHRGTQFLLEQADLTIHPGWKVGIIGANGVGKSSLFKLLINELQADAGDCYIPANLTIAHMAQEVTAGDRTVIDYVLDGDKHYVRSRKNWRLPSNQNKLRKLASYMPNLILFMATAPTRVPSSYWLD